MFYCLACHAVARATSQPVLNGNILVSFIQLLSSQLLGLHEAKSEYPYGLLNKHRSYHPPFSNSSQLIDMNNRLGASSISMNSIGMLLMKYKLESYRSGSQE